MKNILFEGIYSAVFSIYDESMNVKEDSVKRLIQYGEQNGLRGFYVGGNTGECTVLPNRTRKQMLECVKKHASPSSKIIAHVGAGHLEDVEELIEHANAVGVDATASLPPSLTSYYRADEILEYYKHIAELSHSPVLAYVTSVLTCDLVKFTEQVIAIDNVIGLKMSIPDYYAFERIKCVNGGDINVLNGPDEYMLSGLAMGADGAIGTSYNLMPAQACGIYDSFKAGKLAEALSYQHKLNRYIDAFVGNGISAWKSALRLIDIDPGYTVAPARKITNEAFDAFVQVLKENGSYDEIVKYAKKSIQPIK